MENTDYKQMESQEPEGMLLIRYICGLTTEEENTTIAKWRRTDPDNEKILLQTARIYYAQRTKIRLQARNPEKAYAKVKNKMQRKVKILLVKRILALAGCVALLVSLTLNFYNSPTEEEIKQYITMQTNAGMRSNFQLPDGTEVFLNSGTTLIYPVNFDPHERRVELDGEGYFKVVHNPDQPFIVSMYNKLFDVEVVGTEFNIQAYATEDLLTTTLVEGIIRLGIKIHTGEKKYTTLHPSQKATFDLKTRELVIENVNTEYDTAWMHGKLMFKDTPLPEVLNHLSRYYNVQFRVEDPAINKYTFTGTFENRQLSQILDYLSISSRIKYTILTPSGDDSRGLNQTCVIINTR